MIVRVNVGDRFDIDVVAQWIIDHCTSFVTHRFVTHRFVDGDENVELRLQDYPWFQMEVEFNDERDATMFLLRWS